jgi:hypothetical protein
MDALEESVEVLERLSLNYKNAPSRFRPSFASTIHSLIDPVASVNSTRFHILESHCRSQFSWLVKGY